MEFLPPRVQDISAEKSFHNRYPRQGERSVYEVLKWLMKREAPQRPEHVPYAPKKVARERVGKGELSVTFINHSTVLVQVDEVNILTDPIWSERCSPFTWAGPKRIRPPGILFEDLPPIDIVLISHNHYDHMDMPTLQNLFRLHRPLFCVPVGNRKLLKSNGLRNIVEFSWWGSEKISPSLELHFVPAQHFARRGLFDGNKSLWGGFVIKGHGAPIYFAGDTAYGSLFYEIHRRFGPLALALLPIGAFKPRWFMKTVHMSPEDAVLAHLDLASMKSIGIHFGTFLLGDEAYDEPISELERALKKYSVDRGSFITLLNGESCRIEHYT